MSGIGRAGKPTTNKVEGPSIEDLEKELEQTVNKIRVIIGPKSDRQQLDLDQKREVRSLYFSASLLAKKISDRYTDEKKATEYLELYKKFGDRAQSYGSASKRHESTTTLDDVKGLDNVKSIVKTFIFMAENPQVIKYYKIKGGLGLMMYGAPGTGKTMIAEAIANEMKLPLFIVTPADIFKSYVGESEQAVKQLFEEIEMCDEGSILFVDECESIFSKRTNETKDYKSAVTTELLQALNGFGVDGSKRILIAATNRPDQIDPAYLRYKRFSHLVHVEPPDATARRAIVENKLSGIALDGVGIDDIMFMMSQNCGGETIVGGESIMDSYYSSADICGIIEEACRIAMEKIIEARGTQPIPLTREMFEQPFAKIPPSISGELLKEYADFRKNINQ